MFCQVGQWMVGIKRLIQEARHLEPGSPIEPTVPDGSPLSLSTTQPTTITTPLPDTNIVEPTTNLEPGSPIEPTVPGRSPLSMTTAGGTTQQATIINPLLATITTPLPDTNIVESATNKLQGTNLEQKDLAQIRESKQESSPNEQNESSQKSGVAQDKPEVQLLNPAENTAPSVETGESKAGSGSEPGSKSDSGSQVDVENKPDANSSSESNTNNKTADISADVAQSGDDVSTQSDSIAQSSADVKVADTAELDYQSENKKTSEGVEDNSGSAEKQNISNMQEQGS